MSDFLNNLTTFGTAVFQTLTQIFNLYTGTTVLVGVFALWILRKIVNLIRLIF